MNNSQDQTLSTKHNPLGIKEEEIRIQVGRITGSPEFEKSLRLQALLNYVIDETLAGRNKYIKGYTIGQAVYGADENFDPDSNSIVRVEAARLRQRLGKYYTSSGHNDRIVVDIPKGSYVPRFTLNQQWQEESKSSPQPDHHLKSTTRYRWLTVGVLVLTLVLGLSWRYYDALDKIDSGETSQVKNQSYEKESEAQILFRQAFVLLMPPEDGARLTSSQQLFQRVIEINPNFAGGYAGKSIALSFQVLFIKSKDPTNLVSQAVVLAKKAVNFGPDSNLSYAALALAQSLNAEPDKALTNARRVVAIQPREANANAIASIALIISGRPSNAIDLTSEALKLNPDEPRTPYLNILGVAHFLNGDYSGAVKSIENNLVRNGPTGPHMDAVLAASYAQLGKDFEAQAIIEKLNQTNPEFPVKSWFGNFIKSEDKLQMIMHKLQSLGLSRS